MTVHIDSIHTAADGSAELFYTTPNGDLFSEQHQCRDEQTSLNACLIMAELRARAGMPYGYLLHRRWNWNGRLDVTEDS